MKVKSLRRIFDVLLLLLLCVVNNDNYNYIARNFDYVVHNLAEVKFEKSQIKARKLASIFIPNFHDLVSNDFLK